MKNTAKICRTKAERILFSLWLLLHTLARVISRLRCKLKRQVNASRFGKSIGSFDRSSSSFLSRSKYGKPSEHNFHDYVHVLQHFKNIDMIGFLIHALATPLLSIFTDCRIIKSEHWLTWFDRTRRGSIVVRWKKWVCIININLIRQTNGKW